jgi:hypothetical protein
MFERPSTSVEVLASVAIYKIKCKLKNCENQQRTFHTIKKFAEILTL